MEGREDLRLGKKLASVSKLGDVGKSDSLSILDLGQSSPDSWPRQANIGLVKGKGEAEGRGKLEGRRGVRGILGRRSTRRRLLKDGILLSD